MTDPRYIKLARLLVDYSTELKKGDRVLLDMIDVPDEFTVELMRAARRSGAIPIVEVRHTRVTREIMNRVPDAGTVVSPGEFYGEAGSGHVRVAVVQPDERLELIARRLGV